MSLIQLRREGKESSPEYKIISEHMEIWGNGASPEIATTMNISVKKYRSAPQYRALNPRPGQVFAAAPQKLRPS